MSTPDSPCPPGQQGPGGQGGHQQDPYQQPQYQQPDPYQQPPYTDTQYPQAGPSTQPGHSVPSGPEGYLRGGPVGPGDAVKLAFRYAFRCQGRASRPAYWWFMLVISLAVLGLSYISVAVSSSAVNFILGLLFVIGALLVGLPLTVRRLHDTGRSGYWLLIWLVPFGGIVVLVFTMVESTPGPNRFGG